MWTLERWSAMAGRYNKAQVREALAQRGFPDAPIVDGKPAVDLPSEELEQIVVAVMSGEAIPVEEESVAEPVTDKPKRGRKRK